MSILTFSCVFRFIKSTAQLRSLEDNLKNKTKKKQKSTAELIISIVILEILRNNWIL